MTDSSEGDRENGDDNERAASTISNAPRTRPAVLKVPPEAVCTFSVCERDGKHLDQTRFQADANRYVLQIFASYDASAKEWNYGTGFLVEDQGYGYLATCAHIFEKNNLRFAVNVNSKELQRDTDPRFGLVMADWDTDVAFIQILDPGAVAAAGKRFFPILPPTPPGVRFRVANGFPSYLTSDRSVDTVDGVDLISQVSRLIHVFELPGEATEHHAEALAKRPTATIGFRVEWLQPYDPILDKMLPFPPTVRGMSGGPVWGIYPDYSVKPIGLLTFQKRQLTPSLKTLPSELYGIPIDFLFELLTRSPGARGGDLPTG